MKGVKGIFSPYPCGYLKNVPNGIVHLKQERLLFTPLSTVWRKPDASTASGQRSEAKRNGKLAS